MTQAGTDSPRSQFVTALAWVFIVLSGFGTFISIVQNLMLQVMLRNTDLRAAMSQMPADAPGGALPAWAAQHFEWLFLAVLIVPASMLVVSIGLLRRREWARRAFIALMGLTILWQLLGVVLQFFFTGLFQPSMDGMPADFAGSFRAMLIGIQVFSLVMAAGFCVLFGWIIRRLMSAPIRAEFASTR